MLHGLVYAACLAFGHVEIVIGIDSIAQELGKELEPVDLVDRVLEVLHGTCQVEHHDQRGVYLIRGGFGEARSLGFKSGSEFSELRRESCALTTCAWFR